MFMRQSANRVLQILALASIAVSFSAGAIEIACPASIDLNPLTASNTPTGWSMSQRVTTLWVQGALITVGPPAERTDLKPDIKVSKGHKSFHWQFGSDENAKGLWLSCGYGDSLVLLSQKLPHGISQCRTAEPQPDAQGVSPVRVECR